MKPEIFLKVFLLIGLILIFSSGFSQNDTQNLKSNERGNLDEVNLIFDKIIDFVVYHKPVDNVYHSDIDLIIENQEIKWQGKSFQSVISLNAESRDSMKRIYKKDLNDLFKDFLESNNWNVEFLSSDHWGESKYRVLYHVSNGNNTFDYVFEAQNLQNGDWDMTVYILSKSESPSEKIECDYDDFFTEVIEYLENRTKNIDEINTCLIANFYDNPIDYELDGKNYKIKISFYCQFGHSSTPNGYSCFDLLPSYFKSFLEKHDYSVVFKEDHSETGWIKHLWTAEKKKSSFLYIYESESSMTSGYSKICIIEK